MADTNRLATDLIEMEGIPTHWEVGSKKWPIPIDFDRLNSSISSIRIRRGFWIRFLTGDSLLQINHDYKASSLWNDKS